MFIIHPLKKKEENMCSLIIIHLPSPSLSLSLSLSLAFLFEYLPLTHSM